VTVSALSAGSKTRVVVNDRADVAIASGCDGVHSARRRPAGGSRPRPVARPGTQGRGLLIGRSIHGGGARTHASADYLLFGAVYQSGGKPGLGFHVLRAAASAFSGPVIAIGGVTVLRAAECLAAGAAGVAAIRLFLPPGRAEGALGVAEAVSRLRAAFDPATTRHLQ
jgi:thiamine-phosphate pyrophosphorylase